MRSLLYYFLRGLTEAEILDAFDSSDTSYWYVTFKGAEYTIMITEGRI